MDSCVLRGVGKNETLHVELGQLGVGQGGLVFCLMARDFTVASLIKILKLCGENIWLNETLE